MVLALGVPRMRLFGHDVFISLDGGWRVLNGQRPVVDFYAQMGPAYYLLHAAGMWLAGTAAAGLGSGYSASDSGCSSSSRTRARNCAPSAP